MPSEAADAALLPIREVARLTGVNPVTLRAWERRYGLIVPQRTGKGHRLYNSEQVGRIQQILGWLARGVAVGQVRELLDGSPLPASTEQSPWQSRLDSLLQAIGALSSPRLDEQLNHAMALYPPATLYQHLLAPLLQRLQQHWHGQPGSTLEQVFFHGWLHDRLAARVQFQRRHADGPLLLLATLESQPDDPPLWLCAWLLAEQGLRIEVLDRRLPASELLLACQRLQPAALLLHAESSIDSHWLRRQLPLLDAQTSVPLLLCGSACRIHQDTLDGLPGLVCSESPLQLREHLATLPTTPEH